jgi:hypothetical protein
VSPKPLRLAKGLVLPADAVTQTFAIFGKRGSGKTNGATVLVEELLKAHLPVVILDPVDAWWGLKASFDGKGPGFPIYVFGGAHGDLPLEPTSGALIANVVATERLPMILSMKTWGVAERARFVTDFAKQLLQVNKEPVMMVLEEADAFIPQRPAKGEEAMLGAMDRLVRWGRGSGVGCTIVTQRSAKVNKDVTTQAETLIAFRTTGPQDRDAIDGWIKHHAGDERREEVLSTLPALPTGTAWVWSPEWLEFFGKAAFRRRQTFDSAATPKVGQKVRPPKQLAAVDLEQLRTQMAETVEKAKAEDPRELKKTIADLKKQLAAKQPPPPAVKGKTVAALTDADRALLANFGTVLAEVRQAIDGQGKERITRVATKAREEIELAVASSQGQMTAHAEAVAMRLERPGFQRILDKLSALSPEPSAHDSRRPAVSRAVPPTGRSSAATRPNETRAPRGTDGSGAAGDVSPARQKILNGLAFLAGIGVPSADKTQLALIVGVSPTSGGYFNNLGALRSSGLIEYPTGGTVALTDTGAGIASTDGVPSTTRELHDAIRAKLPPAKWKILETLISVYPASLSKDEVAERVEVSPTSGGYFNNLGSLRSLGLISYPRPSEVAAQPVLFLEER